MSTDIEHAPQTLLDAASLARRLGVGVALVDELRRTGRIPYLKLGQRTVRFDFGEVLRALRVDSSQPRREGAA